MSDLQGKNELDPLLENSLINIEEERLPEILSQRLEMLEKTNLAYSDAKEKEAAARTKVADALKKADELIEEAGHVGGHTAEQRKFLWIEWTSKADEIEALKRNLQDIIEHGENSAIAQKELVEVQAALTESQTALLKVQEAQMAYQSQIADATKFLYGLSAYNMASVQSVLINLKAVLSGASKEKLGEMAQQQLLLAMDQIKNQESIILRIRENKELIDSLDFEMEESESKIEELKKQDEEQDTLIENLQKQDEEHDTLIEDLQKQDEEQDALIENLQKQDEEHDTLIEDLQKQDAEQDSLIENLQKQDEEHDTLIEDLQKQDEEQDSLIEDLQKQDEEHDKLIDELVEKVKCLQNENESLKIYIEKLSSQIEEIEVVVNRKVWRVVVSAIAIGSFLLTLLQILGVI